MLPTGQSAFWRSRGDPALIAEYWFLSKAEHDDRRFRKRWGLSEDALDRQFAREHCRLSDDQVRTALTFHRAARRGIEEIRRKHDTDRSVTDLYDCWFLALRKVMARLELRYGDPVDDRLGADLFRNGCPDLDAQLKAHTVARDYADSEAAMGHDRMHAFLVARSALERYAVFGDDLHPGEPVAIAPASPFFSFDLGCRDRGSGDSDEADPEPLGQCADTSHGRLGLRSGWAVFSSVWTCPAFTDG